MTKPDTEGEAAAAEASRAAAASIPTTGHFPCGALKGGARARRASWAPGYELYLAAAASRTGGHFRLMATGGRGGPVEWKPQHPADELMADDWNVVKPVTREPMP
jgi:hypothetical protein